MINVEPALEARQLSSKLLNEDGAPMKIALVTDKIIMKANLKEVSNPIMFNRNREPTSDGIFSREIFGETAEEQRRLLGYIDLHEKFFHPFVFEILKRLQRSIEVCASGEGSWTINSSGKLEEIKDENSPNYDPDATGLQWLIEHFHEIKFETNESFIRNERIKTLAALTDDEIFITKWLVIPRFYRDMEEVNGRPSIPEINTKYNKLIQYSESLKDDLFSFYNNKARYALQSTLIDIRTYGQSLIEGKHGFMHQSVMGKSIDRGSTDVISVPILANIQKPDDNPVDIFHTGVPLAKCLVLGYNFVMRYCLNFFKDNLTGSGSNLVRLNTGDDIMAVKEVKLKDPMSVFTTAYLDKRITEFLNTHSTRFDPIRIPGKDGRDYTIRCVGRYGPIDEHNPKATTIINRAMTWTDLFYIASVETLSDKHIWVTRYPLTDQNSSFPSLCMPLSTITTTPAIIMDKPYPYYPMVTVGMDPSKVSTQFIDTLTMSVLYLNALGGDYDGDTCISKMVYSLEANAEADRIMRSPLHYLSVNGNIIRDIGNEAYLSFYNMTRYK